MLVKGFYEAMNSSQISIDVNSMESLDVLCNKNISINEAAELLIKEVKKRTSNIIYLEKDDFNQEKFAFSLEHTKRKNKQIKLFAYKLSIIHPTLKHTMIFKANPPKEWNINNYIWLFKILNKFSNSFNRSINKFTTEVCWAINIKTKVFN